jgi:hypothetical protein
MQKKRQKSCSNLEPLQPSRRAQEKQSRLDSRDLSGQWKESCLGQIEPSVGINLSPQLTPRRLKLKPSLESKYDRNSAQ